MSHVKEENWMSLRLFQTWRQEIIQQSFYFTVLPSISQCSLLFQGKIVLLIRDLAQTVIKAEKKYFQQH